ncbi:Glucose dehydrogenase -like protein [Halotydeus destructor]|nr:Glucose dehydrogenase -like protein [Halotydeus destructor]
MADRQLADLGNASAMFTIQGFLLSVTPVAVTSFLLLWFELGSNLSPSSWEKEYDYVIIGGGTAGSVLANRLSMDPRVQVLLIESGGYESPVTDIPSLAALLPGSAVDWRIRSVPQAHCCSATDGKRAHLTQGKVLGGTSVLNFMMYVRGNGRDYRDWVDAGAQGWSYQDNLPYFLRIEDMGIGGLRNSSYHGRGGPLKLSYPNFVTPIGPAFVQSGRHLGYNVGDYNGAKPNVFSGTQTTTRKGSRQSAAKSYIDPVVGRSNLKVLTYATAHRILFDNKLRARAVLFNRQNNEHMVLARKEVILAAGGLQSPKVLMQSGIGPQDHLKALKIPVVKHLPGVGQNLQDHPTVAMDFVINKSVSWSFDGATTPQSVVSYLTTGKGPLASNLAEAIGFVNTKHGPSYPFPDAQIIMLATSSQAQGDKFSLLPVLLRPRSRGTVKLRSSSWRDGPLVDPNYFSDPEDLEDVVNAMEVALKLTSFPPMSSLNPRWLNTSIVGCEKFVAPSRDYMRCFARSKMQTLWHFSGTCKMGSPTDKMAVVNPHLQVIGVKGLRVADASVMPNVVSGNTQATVYMIAERGADMIKGKMLEPSSLTSGGI